MPVDGDIISNASALARLGVASLTGVNSTLLDTLIPRVERAVQDFVGYDVLQSTYTEYLPDEDLVLPNDPLMSAYEGSSRGAIPILRLGMTPLPMTLSRVPVRSITTLYENQSAQETAGGSWTSDDLLTEGRDFFVDWKESGLSWTGKVFRQSGNWPMRRRTVKIVYVHGFTAGELASGTRFGTAFREACFDTLVMAWAQIKLMQPRGSNANTVGPIVSEKFEGWSVTYSEAMIQKLAGMELVLPASARKMLRGYVHVSKMMR